jgi:3-oxoacyl-[acyl-carrier protein] reductase
MALGIDLSDKRVVVTGGASGIGAAVVDTLLEAGATPIVIDRVMASLPDSYEADVSSEKSVERVFQLIGKGGPIDGLVTCAGITRDGFLTQMSVAAFLAVVEVNLVGTFLSVREAVKLMAEDPERGGSIVTISSIGADGNKGQANYAASKAGVIALTKTTAMEQGRNNVRANTILPGPIETPMLASVPEKVLDGWKKATPLGRIGQPADIANAVIFLLSPMASHITGAELPVSGGMHF